MSPRTAASRSVRRPRGAGSAGRPRRARRRPRAAGRRQVTVGDLWPGEVQHGLHDRHHRLAGQVGLDQGDEAGGRPARRRGPCRGRCSTGAARVSWSSTVDSDAVTASPGALVQPDLGVAEVAVVDHQQVGAAVPRAAATGRASSAPGRRPGARAGPAAPAAVAGPGRTAPTRIRWGAADVPGVRRHHRGVAVGDLGAQGVHAAGPQPALGPAVHVAAAAAPARASSRSARSALPNRWRAKCALTPRQERLLADPGHELAQHGRALGVGDPVEVDQRRRGVVDARAAATGWVEGRWSAS